MEKTSTETHDPWREADALFAAALDVPPSCREKFLDRKCAGRPGLRREVEALLRVDTTAEAWVEHSAEVIRQTACSALADSDLEEDLDGLDGSSDTDLRGKRIGPYRLVRHIGRGGMANVYLAERADGQWEQHVAIKLLRRGIDTDDVVRRFVGERQILSSLAHPNIARLLDGGATEDGLPFLVMEHIAGIPVDRYCDERRLPVDDRLRLFRDVGRAVQHAHGSLIVHRDLKPSNILVDADGVVKLLDFGIAKLLDGGGSAEATRAGLIACTPEYASPEQIRGDPITTASDVYQLGLLLCALLTGRRPYDVRALSPASAERTITEVEPARPSTLVDDETAKTRSATRMDLGRRLRGDLDTIVLHALRKEPGARYPSAEALVDDVERHMAGQPVRARPNTPGYRARKFIARHLVGVAAVAAFVVLLVASAIIASVQASRFAAERDRALAQEARAEEVTDFVTDLFRVTDPNQAAGEEITALQLLDAGAARAITELEGRPRTQAEVLGTIGTMYVRRGHYRRGAALLERTVELLRAIDGDPADLIRGLRRLAAAVYYDNQRSVRLLEEAAAVAERELGPDHALFAATLTDLAERLGESQAPDAHRRANGTVERAIAILRRQKGDVRAELAAALNFSALGWGPERLPRLQEALELRRSLYGDNHTSVAATLSDMALVLEPSDPAAADTLLEQAAAINVRIHGPDHAQTLTILNNLAGRYRDRGDFAKAEPLYREILRRRRLAYPRASVPNAYTLHGLGWSLTELGRPNEAEPPLREMLHILAGAGYDDPSSPSHILYQVGRSTLGRCLAAQGRFAEAEPLLRDSFEWAAAQEPVPSSISFMLERVIELYEEWGDPETAAAYRARGLEREKRTVPSATASEVIASPAAEPG